MSRADFFQLRDKCINNYPGKYESGSENYQMAKYMGNVSGGFISIEIKLCITLRMLAGASYLDMIWYGISSTYVHVVFLEMLKLLNTSLTNDETFDMDYSADSLNNLALEWSAIMLKKKNYDLLKGTILAGDGLVVAINCPTEKDRNISEVLDTSNYFNRKGCFGIIVQAFCDAYGIFRVFEVRWPGSTNDITAYKQTELYQKYCDGKIPDGYHFVLDEAYSSINGPSHLTPFSKSQLRKAYRKSEDEYLKLKAFNFILSSQRITIERAFGMLVRKWGILWRPLEHSLQTNILITFVCAKLHNYCLRSWKASSPISQQYTAIAEESFRDRRDSNVFMRWIYTQEPNTFDIDDNDDDEEDNGPDDEEVMSIMANRIPSGKRASTLGMLKKMALVEAIYDCGIRYTRETDKCFLRIDEEEIEI